MPSQLSTSHKVKPSHTPPKKTRHTRRVKEHYQPIDHGCCDFLESLQEQLETTAAILVLISHILDDPESLDEDSLHSILNSVSLGGCLFRRLLDRMDKVMNKRKDLKTAAITHCRAIFSPMMSSQQIILMIQETVRLQREVCDA